MKKWMFYISLLCLPCLSGCNSGKTSAEATDTGMEESTFRAMTEATAEKTGNAEVTTTEDPHKVLNYDEISNKKYAWWFKRNDSFGQPEAQQEVNIEQYDAWYVDPGQKDKVIYLTFDCGYENGFTPPMLDALKKHNAKGVFFITKHFAKSAADIVKRMKEEGHYVGNHTASHPDLTAMDSRSVKMELKDCEEAVKEYTGYEMDLFFRPPKGEYSERVLKIAQDMGYKTLFWSLAYLDYDVNNQPGKDYVIDHYKKYIHPGAIPLIHNVSESNAEALDQVLTDLETAGYQFGDPVNIGNSPGAVKKKKKSN